MVMFVQVTVWLLGGDMSTAEQRDHFVDVTVKVCGCYCVLHAAGLLERPWLGKNSDVLIHVYGLR